MSLKFPSLYLASVWFLERLVNETSYIQKKQISDWLLLLKELNPNSKGELVFTLQHRFLWERALKQVRFTEKSLINSGKAFELLIHLVHIFHQDLLVHTPNIKDKLLSLKKHRSKQQNLWEYWDECLVFAAQSYADSRCRE